jgi:hypothetical protein
MDVGTYIDRLAALDFQQIAVECMKSNEPILLDANIDQLKHGKRSTGEQIGTYKNESYARMKNRMNPLPGLDSVDLILTGAFARGIFVNFTNDSMIFDSDRAEKDTGNLLEIWGKNVLGIFMTEPLKNDIQLEFIAIVKNKIAL